MWRTTAAHERKPTEFIDDAMERVGLRADLRDRADDALRAEAVREPIVADALRTPQTPPHHAEGPFLEDHLRLMLQTLYAVLDDDLHLTGLEELARLKGYEGEVEEIEETIKENAALYETFVLCHDAAKWSLVSFDSAEGSRGRSEGFVVEPWTHRHDDGAAERARLRAKFLDLYAAFAAAHPGSDPRDIQTQFHLTYGIRAHYGGHGRAIHAPAYRALLERVAGRRSLPPRDVDLLETLIACHLDPIADFAADNPGAVLRYHALAARHGYDADDFVDLLQGCLFLDTVCGSRRQRVGGSGHETDVLVRFLRSEHDFAPWRRTQKEREREARRVRARNVAFRAAGLDGVALMELLGMEPGPEFGAVLRRVQEAVVDGTPVPTFGAEKDRELKRRATRYFENLFETGE